MDILSRLVTYAHGVPPSVSASQVRSELTQHTQKPCNIINCANQEWDIALISLCRTAPGKESSTSKLIQLQDDERLDALLKDLAKRAPDVLSSVSDDTYSTDLGTTRSNMTNRSPTSEVAADLQKIKGAIAGMQQKLQHSQKAKKR